LLWQHSGIESRYPSKPQIGDVNIVVGRHILACKKYTKNYSFNKQINQRAQTAVAGGNRNPGKSNIKKKNSDKELFICAAFLIT
jgi:hypothetical protein